MVSPVSQAWWCTHVNPALRRPRQDDHQEFEANLHYTGRPYLKKRNEKESGFGLHGKFKASLSYKYIMRLCLKNLKPNNNSMIKSIQITLLREKSKGRTGGRFE